MPGGRPKKYHTEEELLEARRITTKMSRLRVKKANEKGLMTERQQALCRGYSKENKPPKPPRKHGGARKGAGRPPTPRPTVVLGLRLIPEIKNFYLSDRGLAQKILTDYYMKYGVKDDGSTP